MRRYLQVATPVVFCFLHRHLLITAFIILHQKITLRSGDFLVL
jgi:hypothetical protein